MLFLQSRTSYLDTSFVAIKWSFLDLQSQFCHSGIVWEPLSWRSDSYWLWWKESTNFSFCHFLVKCESLFGIQSSKSYQIRFQWKSCIAGWALSESKMEQKERFVMLDFHLCKKNAVNNTFYRKFHSFTKLELSWSVKMLAYGSHHVLLLVRFLCFASSE